MKHFNVKRGENNSIRFKKIFILTTMFVLCFQIMFAQKCNLEKLKDDFSTSKTVCSKEVTIASVFPLIGSKKPWDMVMHFMLDNSTCTIIITHKDQSLSSNLENIFFKFKDETILKLENPLNAGTYNTGLGYIFSSTAFVITKDELMKFGSVDLIKFKASLKNNINYPIVEEEIKQKNIEKIKNDASCILNEYNIVSNGKKEIKKDEVKVVDYKCEYSSDKVDAFTKQRIVYTNGGMLFDEKESNRRTWINALANNTNGKNGIQIEWGIWSSDDLNIADVQSALQFDQIDLLLENEEVVSLTDKTVTKFINKAPYFIGYKLFMIDDSSWIKLRTFSIKNLRLLLNNEVIISPEVIKNNSLSIVNVIKCLDNLGITKPK